jgi:hypothetical protein
VQHYKRYENVLQITQKFQLAHGWRSRHDDFRVDMYDFCFTGRCPWISLFFGIIVILLYYCKLFSREACKGANEVTNFTD